MSQGFLLGGNTIGENDMLKRKDMLGLIDTSAEEIDEILNLAAQFKSRIKNGEKNLDALTGKTATVLFYENSTRTRTSFEQAAKYFALTVCQV